MSITATNGQSLTDLTPIPGMNFPEIKDGSCSTPLGIGQAPIRPQAPTPCLNLWGRPVTNQNRIFEWLHHNSFTVFFLFTLGFLGMQWWFDTPTFFLQGQLIVMLLSATMLIQALRFKDLALQVICFGSMGSILVLDTLFIGAQGIGTVASHRIHGFNLIVLCGLLALLIGVLVYHLWHNDYTGRNALFCAGSSYLLIGFLWSCIFCTISFFDAGSFQGGNSVNPDGNSAFDYHRLLYFSMITLTTVGYGDITPMSPIARSLCWMEAGIGQFYFGFILARLVSTQFMQNRTDKGWRHDPNTNAFKTPVPPNKMKAA